MSTSTLYYLCQSEDASSGLFGTADECAYWYLTYGGADYRVYPKLDGQSNDGNGGGDRAVTSASGDQGSEPAWSVAFKAADSNRYRESPMTVFAADENAAHKAVRQEIVETRLVGNTDADENFYMISAEQALPILMWVAEMREIYDLANQPPTDNEKDVKKWFWNTEHSKQALCRMVDFLTCRQRMTLSSARAEQIKSQIEAIAVAPGKLMQHKASIAHHYLSAGKALS